MSGHGPPGWDGPPVWDGEGDEPTTILRAPPDHAPASAPDLAEDPFGAPPEDERTRILQAPPQDEVTTIQTRPFAHEDAYGAPPEDERTHILQAPPRAEGALEDDERTSIIQAPSTAPLSASAELDEATSILVAPSEIPAAQDATEIMRAVAPSGLHEGAWPGGSASGRAWFDARLADFTGALLYDQAGVRRPAEDRRALGSAARDMIERLALRDAPAARGEGALKDGTLQPGQLLINTYFVRALIARGGVGEIYRARHRDLKTEHAIKILLPRYALDATVLSLMLEEARLLALVRHEAVVGCQGLLRDSDGRPMLVMEYLRGCTLSARLRDGPLEAADLLVLTQRLAAGLAAIHAQGVVHQDISPDNIILAENSPAGATIIDFGLARSLSDGGSAPSQHRFCGQVFLVRTRAAGRQAGRDRCPVRSLQPGPGACRSRAGLPAGHGQRLGLGAGGQAERAASAWHRRARGGCRAAPAGAGPFGKAILRAGSARAARCKAQERHAAPLWQMKDGVSGAGGGGGTSPPPFPTLPAKPTQE